MSTPREGNQKNHPLSQQQKLPPYPIQYFCLDQLVISMTQWLLGTEIRFKLRHRKGKWGSFVLWQFSEQSKNIHVCQWVIISLHAIISISWKAGVCLATYLMILSSREFSHFYSNILKASVLSVLCYSICRLLLAWDSYFEFHIEMQITFWLTWFYYYNI